MVQASKFVVIYYRNCNKFYGWPPLFNISCLQVDVVTFTSIIIKVSVVTVTDVIEVGVVTMPDVIKEGVVTITDVIKVGVVTATSIVAVTSIIIKVGVDTVTSKSA